MYNIHAWFEFWETWILMKVLYVEVFIYYDSFLVSKENYWQ